MILGVGTDLCNIDRIESTLARFGHQFLKRIFSYTERVTIEQSPARRISRYAMGFAAKEACAKALGTGFRQGVCWRDIILYNDMSRKPKLRLEGGAKRQLHQVCPKNFNPDIHISLTDTSPMAHAIVIISARSFADHS
tara:strand:+ start:890 stop:1303 length:414 start_codon:yes stop_codon:yes gene_type:complete